MESHYDVRDTLFFGDACDCVRDIDVVAQQLVEVDVRCGSGRRRRFENFAGPFFQPAVFHLVVYGVQRVESVVVFFDLSTLPRVTSSLTLSSFDTGIRMCSS